MEPVTVGVVADCGPRLRMVAVTSTVTPAAAVAGFIASVTARSAPGPGIIVAVAGGDVQPFAFVTEYVRLTGVDTCGVSVNAPLPPQEN